MTPYDLQNALFSFDVKTATPNEMILVEVLQSLITIVENKQDQELTLY